jgi:5'-3' exonuclease
MGVPGFFVWLLKNYKNKEDSKIITNSVEDDIDILYLDSNCLFHPQCFKVLEHNKDWTNRTVLEEQMIKRILNYIDYLINVVNPKKYLYISVDGVAPMAKMNQQRKRRYKRVIDNRNEELIKQKYEIGNTNKWSNVVITPGTEFMEKLHQSILKYMTTKKLKIEYSSYHTEGEGEHKILQDIRLRNNSNESYVIYGLDADLIFLALSCNHDNIYLLRETNYINRSDGLDDDFEYNVLEDVHEELCFVSIDEMKLRLNESIDILIKDKCNDLSIEDDHINDFIFICYFLGNDFLPHIPSINVKTKGLEFLIKTYIETLIFTRTKLIIRDNKRVELNDVFLEIFLDNIAKYEDYYFKNILPRHREYVLSRQCDLIDQCERELWEYRNLRDIRIDDNIELGKDSSKDYKYRYYEHYFGIVDHQQEHINRMCFEYFKGLLWVTKYYFDRCPSWKWQYSYSHGPFISDLSLYFRKGMRMNINNIKFDNYNNIKPLEQLLAVLPPTHAKILPENYQWLMINKESPIIDYYPEDITFDCINKDMQWKCIPLLPIVNIRRIEKAIKNIRLSEEEEERNKEYGTIRNYN